MSDMSFDDVVEKMCQDLPVGWTASLHMENGGAWVTLEDPAGRDIGEELSSELGSGPTVEERMYEMLSVARGEGVHDDD